MHSSIRHHMKLCVGLSLSLRIGADATSSESCSCLPGLQDLTAHMSNCSCSVGRG
jgi:hypothetical protein